MGVVFFVGFLIILCAIAGALLIIGIALLIVGNVRKRQMKKFKGKRIAAIILFCVSAVIFAVPVGWIVMLRASNASTFDGYVDTGVKVTSYDGWSISSSKKFNLNNELYVNAGTKLNGYDFQIGQAVANADTGNYKILDKILNYNSTTTIYAVVNDGGFTILSPGNGLWYREKDRAEIINYYQSLAEYEYFFYSYDNNDDTGNVKIEMNADVFDSLIAKYSSDYSEKAALITEEIVLDGSIKQTSPDGLYLRGVTVEFTETSAYVASSSGGGAYYGYPIDEETAHYLKNVLAFSEKP
ncbi:MAG: hypothetical protein LBN00_02910 [Oscillospiraceae bacterium]|jgi:hypothetical protein|nr:hypothetical protein [Oscillospiraceae bacterium]